MQGNRYRGYDEREPRVIALAASQRVTETPWGWTALATLTLGLMLFA